MKKAYATAHEHDVFISYAHLDNVSCRLGDKEFLWVDHFRSELEERVNQALGHQCKFWYDATDLPGNKPVTPGIGEALEKTACIVILLSPSYMESEWCRKEMAEFKARMDSGGGPKDRIFVVRLRDIPYEKRPGELRDLVGYEFFELGGAAELSPKKDAYRDELVRLREDIANCLRALNDGDRRLSVYLAESSPDLKPELNKISAFIEGLGWKVVPSRVYPRAPAEFAEAAAVDLAVAKLFVQLLGPFATPCSDDLPQGYEGLQAELASELPRIRAYYRETFDWDSLDEEPKRLLEAKDVRAHTRPELENLIKKQLETIQLQESRTGKEREVRADGRNVFVQTTKDDYDIAVGLCGDHLKPAKIGYEIFEDEKMIGSSAEADDPDGFVVVYGPSVDRDWIRETIRRVKSLRLERKPREPAAGVYVYPPHDPAKLPINAPFLHTIAPGSAAAGLPEFLQEVSDRQQHSQ